MNQPARLAAVFAATLVPGFASAQMAIRALPAPAPMPPHAMPVTPPPVEPMTWAAVALQTAAPAPAAMPAAKGAKGAEDGATAAPPVDPEIVAARAFQQTKVAGRDLKASVGRVLGGLDWRDDLLDARATAAATGKPILWIQSLGDLDGFA